MLRTRPAADRGDRIRRSPRAGGSGPARAIGAGGSAPSAPAVVPAAEAVGRAGPDP